MRLNGLLHVSQRYLLTPAWVCRWARRFDLSANARSQCGHWKGRSPVCVRRWPWSNHGRENALPQSGQRHGSVCVRTCIFSAPIVPYTYTTHSSQRYMQWRHWGSRERGGPPWVTPEWNEILLWLNLERTLEKRPVPALAYVRPPELQQSALNFLATSSPSCSIF